jgi:hypothetical protein
MGIVSVYQIRCDETYDSDDTAFLPQYDFLLFDADLETILLTMLRCVPIETLALADPCGDGLFG